MESAKYPTLISPDDYFDHIRLLKGEPTQRLLGTTIEMTDESWQGPSKLPGWTRAHVATHLARNADGFYKVLANLLAGKNEPMYPEELRRWNDIEQGSWRCALDLQIDLDTSAGRLNTIFDSIDQLETNLPNQLCNRLNIPWQLIPLARLHEVTCHHIDLDSRFCSADIDDTWGEKTLTWVCYQIGDSPSYPGLVLKTTSGFSAQIGSTTGHRIEVFGPAGQIYGWLTGRETGEQLAFSGGTKPSVPLL